MGGPVAGAAIAAAALVVTLGGCGAFPIACPAVGWTNTVEVQVPGSAAADSPVREVAYCGGHNCTPPPADDSGTPTAPDTAPTPGATLAAPGAATPDGPLTAKPEPDPTMVPWWPFGQTVEHDGDTWTVVTAMGTPERGRVALRDAAGTTIVERSVSLSWERHGGSAQCGGPSTARTTVAL